MNIVCDEQLVNDIDRELCMASSESRGLVLLEILEDLECNHTLFWRVFNCWWPECDATTEIQDALQAMLRHNANGIDQLSDDARQFFDSLPDPVTVYRGCSRDRIMAMSWTTDRDVAAGFMAGHRGINVPDPVPVTATIRKDEILTVSVDRQESEVIWCPTKDHQIRFLELD